MELNSAMHSSQTKASINTEHKKPSSFRNRLRDRINKNKSHIADLQKVIKQSERDILEISQLKKAIFGGQATPLLTFVEQVKNTTDDALLSMQRELAKKDKELEYVVYDRNVIWLDHKFTSEEQSYQKKAQHTASLFKTNFFDKEIEKYNREVKHSERLLGEGESLMQSCKQQIQQKDQKVRQLANTIKAKEEILYNKMNEMREIQDLLAKESKISNTKMKSHVISAKVKNTKQDIRRLRNERLQLEASEVEWIKEIEALKHAVKKMEKKSKIEESKVDALEKRLGNISDKINGDIEKQSVVEFSKAKLERYLTDEREKKDKLLKAVNTKKTPMENGRYKVFRDTKTMKPIDWNQIDDNADSYISEVTHAWLDEKSIDESKIENEEKQENLSLTEISFR
jgi:chromosome segregation ATPase